MCSLSSVRMQWLQAPATTFLNLKFVSFCLDFDCYPGDDLDQGYGLNFLWISTFSNMPAPGGGGDTEELRCANGTERLVFVHF